MKRSVEHASFTLDHRFPVPPAKVFRAWADPEAKRRWSDCHPDGTSHYSLDFRVGGREVHRASYDGKAQSVEKVFLEIVPDARIIFAYTIAVDGRDLSASLVTVEFHPDGSGTRQALTEQLAYLDGHMDLEARRHGTSEGIDRLVAQLTEAAAAL